MTESFSSMLGLESKLWAKRGVFFLMMSGHFEIVSPKISKSFIYIFFNERKLVLWLAHVCHPQKLVKLVEITMTSEIVRDIKLLNNTTKYCLIFHRIAQYRPVFFHIVQYYPILSSIIQYCSSGYLSFLFSQLYCHVRYYQALIIIVKHLT